MLQCRYCSKEFKYESEKKRHEQSHIPQFECKECCKKFSFLSALRRHLKQHERTSNVECSNCSRSFRDETLLKRHMKYAHKGTFICSKCSTKFNSELALTSHMKTHKPKSERRFKCSYNDCDKSFNFTHHLKHHKLTHTNQKQHYCKICGKGFIQAHHLKTHLKVHQSENRLECPIIDCNKTFMTEYSRKRHLTSHKSTIDSGISSDSNGDYGRDSEKETVLCSTCGQIVTKLAYEMHKDECLEMKGQPKDLSAKVLTNIEFNIDETKSEVDFRCKTLLGRCIVEDTLDDNCLCAQIKENSNDLNNAPNANETYDFVKIEIGTTSLLHSLKNNFKKENTCSGCVCSSNTGCDIEKMNSIKSVIDENRPQIECTNDGVIKILNTFDIDVPKITNLTKKDIKTASIEVFDANNFVPYNSCKDILGKCIVSGNGTISEGCLCAKMAMDDQINNAQEIDELTPQPISMVV